MNISCSPAAEGSARVGYAKRNFEQLATLCLVSLFPWTARLRFIYSPLLDSLLSFYSMSYHTKPPLKNFLWLGSLRKAPKPKLFLWLMCANYSSSSRLPREPGIGAEAGGREERGTEKQVLVRGEAEGDLTPRAPQVTHRTERRPKHLVAHQQNDRQ